MLLQSRTPPVDAKSSGEGGGRWGVLLGIPYPILDRNGQSVYPFSDQNGAKTLPDGAAHTCMAYVREYPAPLLPPGG